MSLSEDVKKVIELLEKMGTSSQVEMIKRMKQTYDPTTLGDIVIKNFSKSFDLPDDTRFEVQTNKGSTVLLPVFRLRKILAGSEPWSNPVKGDIGQNEAAVAFLQNKIIRLSTEETERQQLANIIAQITEDASNGNVRTQTYLIDGNTEAIEIYFILIESEKKINAGIPFYIKKKEVLAAAKDREQALNIKSEIIKFLEQQGWGKKHVGFKTES